MEEKMSKERKMLCQKAVNVTILWMMLKPYRITYNEFLARFEKIMLDKGETCTEEDIDYAYNSLEKWLEMNS